jgi:hypothetical protein
MSMAGQTVSGVVLQDTDRSANRSDGDRPAIAVVDLERRVGDEVAWFVSMYPDRNGRFRFTDVPPGDYAVLAYWPAPFVNPPGLPQARVPAAEWGFTVGAADVEVPPFLATDVGANSPGPAEDRERVPLPYIGEASVADQVIPDVPANPGLTQRVLLPEGARSVIVSRLFSAAESHIGRRNKGLCLELPVVGNSVEITPRFTISCPPGIRVGISVDLGVTRDGVRVLHSMTVEPPLEWRPAGVGEPPRTLVAFVTPPNVGDGGLRVAAP